MTELTRAARQMAAAMDEVVFPYTQSGARMVVMVVVAIPFGFLMLALFPPGRNPFLGYLTIWGSVALYIARGFYLYRMRTKERAQFHAPAPSSMRREF